MEERLYLDGQLVDLGTKNNITLNIKSNLFRDVSKLTSNTTYTVKLPKTVRNMKILGHAELVQSYDTYPYNMHKARYFRNGVEVIKDGRASVMSVSYEAFEVSIVWGLWQNFSELSSKGTTLNQLSTNDRILYQSTTSIAKLADVADDGYFYAGYDVWVHENKVDYTWNNRAAITYPTESTVNTDSTTSFGIRGGGGSYITSSSSGKSYVHPVVRVSWILQLIKEKMGINLKWAGEAKEYIDSMVIPLINKKSNDLTFDSKFAALLLGPAHTGAMTINVSEATNLFKESGDNVVQLTASSDADIILNVSAQYQFSNVGWSPSGRGTRGDFYTVNGYYLKITHGDEELKCGPQRGFRLPTGYHGKVICSVNGNGKVEMKAGETLKFEWCHDRRGLSGYQYIGGSLSATISSDEKVPFGGYFPITDNLPKIKVIEFIKFLAAVSGTFPLQMVEQNEVVFVPLSTVWNNRSAAKDWTRRIIPQGPYNQAKQTEFKMSDYVQHNYYKWKSDDNVIGDYDGDIRVENETLEREKTLYEFPFAACDGNNVPMYTAADTENSGGGFGTGTRPDDSTTSNEPSYSTCTDRILRVKADDNGYAVCYFDMNMQDIIDDKYKNVVETLRNTRMITENVRMSDLDLLNFDETKPVYLAQYGAYFAVIEIKSQSSGIAEATMLELI